MIKKCLSYALSFAVLSTVLFTGFSGKTYAYYETPKLTCAPMPSFASDWKTKAEALFAANGITDFDWETDNWYVFIASSYRYLDGTVAYPGTDSEESAYTTQYQLYLSDDDNTLDAWFDDSVPEWTPSAIQRPNTGKVAHMFDIYMTDRTVSSVEYNAGDVKHAGTFTATSGTSGTWYTLGRTTADSFAYCGGNQAIAEGSPDSVPFPSFAGYFNQEPDVTEEEPECGTLDFKCQFDAVVDGIGDALSALFVPNGDALKLEFDTLMDFFEEKLGFLFFPFDLAVSFYDTFNDAESPQDTWIGNVNHYYCNPLASSTWIESEDREGIFANFSMNMCAFEQAAPAIFEFMQNMIRIGIVLLLTAGFYHKLKGVLHK